MTVNDAAMVHEFRGDPDVVTHLTHPALSLDQVVESLTNAADLWPSADRQRFNLLFAVVLEGIVIGDVHAWNMTESFESASPDHTDAWISYAFNPRYQGRGYAIESIRAVLAWLSTRGTLVVYANCYLGNTPSIKLLEQLGFSEYRRYSAEEDSGGKHTASCRMRLELECAS